MPAMTTPNRWTLEQTRAGVAANLESEKKKLSAMYSDVTTKAEDREKQQAVVADLTERLSGINKQIAEYDADAQAQLNAARKTEPEGVMSDKDKFKAAYADLIKATMKKGAVPDTAKAVLKLDDGTTGGGSFLPKTVSTEIVTEPMVKNPLREHSRFTSISNLEIPRLDFSSDDDDFIADGETAKEITAKGSTIAFGRNKFKGFVDISESVLLSTVANLVSYVNAGLASALATKERKVAFAVSPTKESEKHMSFYETTVGIKKVEGTTMLSAIRAAIADLDDMFLERAEVCMRRADYLAIVESLANGNATLYTAPPESILGVPVFFCSSAVKPVVGDFSYSHFNYEPAIQYESDKNIKTGVNSFVITAWYDHQIKLASAFRIAEVKSV